MNWSELRRRLEENKIIFETLAATLLSGMAIVVAVAQTCSANKQATLQDLQTKIAEAQALPQFEIRFEQEYDAAAGTFRTNVITITNVGGSVHEVSVSTAEFLEVSSARRFGEHRVTPIAITGYLNSQFQTAATTGLLVTLRTEGNNTRETEIVRGVADLARKSGWAYANIDRKIFLRVTYRDLLGRYHADYFEARPILGAARLKKADGEAIFNRYQHTVHAEFSSLTAAGLFKLLSQRHAA